jgi:8-oxo-dGTP pyrophosphatase MutT (NUDIX family)
MTQERARREQSAGGVVIRAIAGDVHVLLIRDPYGKWGLPKGHLEGGESSRDAALREVREETGLAELTLGPELGTIDWYFRFEGALIHKYCDYFLMVSHDGEARPEVDEGITECVWLPVEEAVTTVAYDNARQVVVRAREVIRSGEADPILESCVP